MSGEYSTKRTHTQNKYGHRTYIYMYITSKFVAHQIKVREVLLPVSHTFRNMLFHENFAGIRDPRKLTTTRKKESTTKANLIRVKS